MRDLRSTNLFDWVTDVDVPSDLRQQVERRRAARVGGVSRPPHASRRRAMSAGRWVAVVVGVGAVVAALALAAHSNNRGTAGGVGSPKTPSALLSRIESGLDRSLFVKAFFGKPPSEFASQVDGPWLYVEVNRRIESTEGIDAQWQADLLAATYAAQAASGGLRPESGFSVFDPTTRGCQTVVSPNCEAPGMRITDALRAPGTTTPVTFNPTRASDAQLSAQITGHLTSAGLTVKSISFVKPGKYLAPVVIAESDNPARFISADPSATSLFGAEPTGFEGIYFQLDDRTGKPVLIHAYAPRIGAAINWIRPDLSPDQESTAAAPTNLRIPLPAGWSSRSFSGGLGGNPHGLQVLVAANRSLPASVAECEALIPRLSSDQVLVRIYDYGSSPIAPQPAQVGVVKLGKILPVSQPNGRMTGFNEIRVRYRGHRLIVDTSFGSPHPSAAIQTQVAALLQGITTR